MPSANNEIAIERPRAAVFAFFADPETTRSGAARAGDQAGLGQRRGRSLRPGRQGPGGRRIPADIEITELTPGATIAFQTVAGPVRPPGRYVLAAVDGATRVRFDSWRTSGGQAPHGAHGAEDMDHEVGRLDRLKHVIEQR